MRHKHHFSFNATHQVLKRQELSWQVKHRGEAISITDQLEARHISPWIGITIALICLLSIGKLVLSNYFVTKGADMAALLAKEEALKEENDILQVRYQTMTSLHYINEQAEAMGLKNSKNVVFVSPSPTTTQVAFNQR